MALSFNIRKLKGEEIEGWMVDEAAVLFSSAYGVWGPLAEEKMGSWAKKGRRVRMSSAWLQPQLFPQDRYTAYVRAEIDVATNLLGHPTMCEAIVPKAWIGNELLREVREDSDRAYGILSSHPAALMATLRAFGRGIEQVDLDMIKTHARGIMGVSPINYVSSATLAGLLFDTSDSGDVVSCGFTNFYVDHGEPDAVVEDVKKTRIWPLGRLPEGYEYLVLVKA